MAGPSALGSTGRITKEIAHIQKGSDLSLAVAVKDSDVRRVRALIIGPPDTPYEFGFFEFDIRFRNDYPITSPGVRCLTTNAGRCRFNPNIYNDGKVCLSILGTWRGEAGEQWSSAQGLESVLLSIQSLMSQNPYENEPGYETTKKEEKLPQAYIAKIRHETIRIAVLQPLETLLDISDGRICGNTRYLYERAVQLAPSSASVTPTAKGADGAATPNTDISVHEYDADAVLHALDFGSWDPFGDLFKRRFLWYYDTYAATIERCRQEHSEREEFKMMDFEGGSNGMKGHFDYPSLAKRLESVAAALEAERKGWEKQGAASVAKESQLATQLAFQFRQLEEKWNKSEYAGIRMEIHLPDPKNPFVWNLTVFGKPMTNLDGGIFNITLSIPPNFPDVQPRVKVETRIFHYRVASSGMLCYFTEKEGEIASHLDGIIAALTDENPNYDPRTVVNPEAFALYWGGEAKRKTYFRKLRRSAQGSSEC